VAPLSQGRTAAAQCGLFTHKSVPVIFEPPCRSLQIAVQGPVFMVHPLHTPTQLGPLERANLDHRSSPPLHLRTETDPIYERSCFQFYRISDDGKSPKKPSNSEKYCC
jgi:hypothetical protein